MPPDWTFLTNHAHVLLCLVREPDLRMRDLAERVGITERAVARIVSDLVRDEYLQVTKHGRRNRYEVAADKPLRHQVEGRGRVRDLFGLVGEG